MLQHVAVQPTVKGKLTVPGLLLCPSVEPEAAGSMVESRRHSNLAAFQNRRTHRSMTCSAGARSLQSSGRRLAISSSHIQLGEPRRNADFVGTCDTYTIGDRARATRRLLADFLL